MASCVCAKLRVNDGRTVRLGVGDGNDVRFSADEYTRMMTSELPEYDGPYDVTPTRALQVLATAAHCMRENVEVGGIPYAAVSNPSGGVTATIG